ncbi:unnamed protein product, partial [Cuscuta campestris]
LLLKDSYFRGLGFWVSPDIPPQEPSGDTTSSWVPPFRSTRLRRRSSRRDPSPEEDTEGEEVGSATGTLSLALADQPPLSEEVVVEDVSEDDGLYDFPLGTLRVSGLIPGVPHTPLFGRGTSSSAQPMGPLGFHPQTSGPFPTGRATGLQGSLEPPHVQADYVATSSAQRHSLRLLDCNAALSKELRDFKSRHSICVERPEYDRVLSENDWIHSDRERLAAKVGQRDLNRIHDAKEIEFLRRDLERQVRERELQVREEAELHRRRSEEELERTWRRRSEEEARKAAEEVEQRWHLQHEETERQLSQRVNELNLTLMEERRSARSSLDEARRSLENERLTYEGHMAQMEADRISDYGQGFYRGATRVSRGQLEMLKNPSKALLDKGNDPLHKATRQLEDETSHLAPHRQHAPTWAHVVLSP